MKPYKGTISNWRRIHVGDVYCIFGLPSGHPTFINWIRTSVVVSEEPHPDGIAIETLNSRYLLIGEQSDGIPPQGLQKP